MRLVAFNIKNFRSIIESGWQNLSSDDITGLIGQNESGKTSVLEALYAFYTGEIKGDDLRDADSNPEVSCSFEITRQEMLELFVEQELPATLLKELKAKSNRINLRRKWQASKIQESVLEIEQPDISSLFEKSKQVTVTPEPVTPAAQTATPRPTTPVSVATTTTVPPTPAPASSEPIPASEEAPLIEKDFIERFYKNIPEFVYFEDYSSLLPNQIDLADIESGSDVSGVEGAKNFLKIIGLSSEQLTTLENRLVKQKIDKANADITTDFQNFWSQRVGKDSRIEIEFQVENHGADEATKVGQPYLAFWVKDGNVRLYPRQRSEGVRWFLSFFIQLRASQKDGDHKKIFLIDEPGSKLHARAQEDVLKLFEDLKQTIQIIYTTHSPYLIQTETIYRLLAVQRAEEEDKLGETKILDIHALGSATTDTLSPLYTLIGVDLHHQRAIKQDHNVLLEEPSAFYYVQAFKQLLNNSSEMNFMPSTGVTKLPQLIYLFLGWGLKFIVVVDDDTAGRGVYNDVKKELFADNEAETNKLVYKIKDCSGVEDLFSLPDFKKYIIEDETLSYTEANSAYLKSQNGRQLSKVVLSIKFLNKVKDGKLKISDLDNTSKTNITSLLNKIDSLLSS